MSTVIALCYTRYYLTEVIEKLRKFRPRTGLNTWRFRHNNAPAHQALLTQEFLEDFSLPLLDHSPFNPDLSPCDFGLFLEVIYS